MAKINQAWTKTSSPTDEQNLHDALRATLSPEGITAVAAYLAAATTKRDGGQPHQSAMRELAWLRDQLIEVLGGDQVYSELIDEIEL